MKPPRLEIPRGERLQLSLENVDKHARISHLRPRTLVGLKRLTGLPISARIRLSDERIFESVEDVRQMVRLWPDKNGKINGIDAAQLKAMVYSAPDTDKMPMAVTITQKQRAWFGPHGVPIPKGMVIDKQRLKELGWIVKTHQMIVPDWLRDFRVYSSILSLGDLIVGPNATFEIGPDITALTATNIHMHVGATIVQKCPTLTVDVSGEIKGDLP